MDYCAITRQKFVTTPPLKASPCQNLFPLSLEARTVNSALWEQNTGSKLIIIPGQILLFLTTVQISGPCRISCGYLSWDSRTLDAWLWLRCVLIILSAARARVTRHWPQPPAGVGPRNRKQEVSGVWQKHRTGRDSEKRGEGHAFEVEMITDPDYINQKILTLIHKIQQDQKDQREKMIKR